MNDATRLAAIAATALVVALGGLLLIGQTLPGPGDPGATATPIPTAASSTPPGDGLGTITLNDDGCTWDSNPGSIEGSAEPLRLRINLGNDTDTFANFGVYLLDEGYAWEDAAAWVRAENDALHGGPSNPPADFVTDVASLDQPTRGQSSANLALGPGTYGIVCSSNEPPPFPGDVYAVYLVGPLEVKAPSASAPPIPTTVELGTSGVLAFDKKALVVEAGLPFGIHFTNSDVGQQHDVDIRDEAGAETIQDGGVVVEGPGEETYFYGALEAGTYTFICSVHPIPAMTGTLLVQ